MRAAELAGTFSGDGVCWQSALYERHLGGLAVSGKGMGVVAVEICPEGADAFEGGTVKCAAAAQVHGLRYSGRLAVW